MKKYIQPQIEVNEVGLLLLELKTSNSEGNEDEFGNSSFFDDSDDISLQSNKSLWDDEE
ncbi:MAG: hypothetical protein J5637_06120 [Prevotella sp.]|nr:hypothetical protein [Prevotella sp.]